MTSEIYINQIPKPLGLLFYEKIVEENGDMIWMHKNRAYHTSKFTTRFYQKMSLLCIIWPIQSLDLNPIENF